MSSVYRVMLAGVLALSFGCAEGEVVPMPPELVGVWTTEAEDYETCYLEISALQLRFGRAGESVSTHEIAEIRELPAQEREFRISYLAAPEGQSWLSIKYSPVSGILRLVNQPQMVWIRSSSSER